MKTLWYHRKVFNLQHELKTAAVTVTVCPRRPSRKNTADMSEKRQNGGLVYIHICSYPYILRMRHSYGFEKTRVSVRRTESISEDCVFERT